MNDKLLELARAHNPFAARMQALSTKDLSVAVKQGKFRGYAGMGDDCRPVTDWFGNLSDCVEALEALA